MNVYIILHTCAYVICIRIHKCVCVLVFALHLFSFHLSSAFCVFSPHLCVGLLFLILYPSRLHPATSAASAPSLSHTIFHTQRHQPSFCLVGVELMALGWLWWRGWYPFFCPGRPRHFAWQAWHLAWQAWHLATSTVFLRGRHGTWRHPPSFCVAHLSNTQPWTHISFKHTYSFHTQTWTHTHIYTQRFHTQHTPTHNSFTQTWTHSSFTRNFVWVTHISFTNLNTQTSTLDKNGSFEWSGRNWVL